ncbi:serine hydrolase domain-containing protein [Candidatus Neomarinimicrobiota bacterium]
MPINIMPIILVSIFLLINCCESTDNIIDPRDQSELAASDPANTIGLVDWITGPSTDSGIDPFMLQYAVDRAAATGFMASLLVVRDDILVSENYFGNHDVTTEFDISHATQGITALLAGIALKEGIISSLDERVLDYFPEYDSLITDTTKRLITLEHLLLNNSGFQGDEEIVIGANHTVKQGLGWEQDWWKYILSLPLTNLPGASWVHSPLSSHLLAGIISKASGTTIKAFAEQYLFDPLGIDIHRWTTDPSGNYCGGWGLYLTPRAMAKIGNLLQSDTIIDGSRLCSAEYLEAVFEPRFVIPWFNSHLKRNRFGYSWRVGRMNGLQVKYGHGYAGQLIINIPDLDLTLVTTAQLNVLAQDADYQNRTIIMVISKDIIPAVIGVNTPTPYPPSNLVSSIESNQSLMMNEEVHWLRWEPDSRISREAVAAYRVYEYFIEADRMIKQEVGEVAGDITSLYVRNVLYHPERTYWVTGITYGVATVDNAGFVGAPQITSPGNQPE